MTQAEERLELLALGLHLFGMEEQDIVITLMGVWGNPRQVETLLDYLVTHEGATTAEISDAVVEIVQTVK